MSNKIYITGDLHGQIENIKQFVEQNRDTHCFDGSDTMSLSKYICEKIGDLCCEEKRMQQQLQPVKHR